MRAGLAMPRLVTVAGPVIARPGAVGQGRRMATVLWARHGENVANLTQTFSYRVFDGDLTPAGRRQARALAARLAGRDGDPVDQLACSPLRRARQTAEVVAQLLALPIAAERDDLRELNVGDLDGRSDEKSWRVYEGVLAAWRAGELDRSFPGGENCVELHGRLSAAIAAVTGPADGAVTAIVAHGGALRMCLPLLTGDPDPGTDIPYGAYAELETAAPGARLRLVSWPTAATGQ
jgi:broad specificity phosphatase PhoE